MKVYLMRHGEPVSKETDPARPLSGQGRRDVERVADHLKGCGVSVDAVFHSGKTRAIQTADIMATRLSSGEEAQEKPGLSPLDDVTRVAGLIRDFEQDLLIVGHLPHLEKLVALLTADNESTRVVRFPQAAVVCLEKVEDRHWAISWMLIPDLLGKGNERC